MNFRKVTSSAFITTKYHRTLIKCVGWDNAVGMTLYGLGSSGFAQRWGRDFTDPSRLALGLAQPLAQ